MVKEAVELLGVTRRTFQRWVRAGRIKGIQPGGRGRTYYDEADVLKLKRGGSNRPPERPRPDRKVVPLRGEQLDLVQAINAGVVSPEDAQALWSKGIVALVRTPANHSFADMTSVSRVKPDRLWVTDITEHVVP